MDLAHIQVLPRLEVSATSATDSIIEIVTNGFGNGLADMTPSVRVPPGNAGDVNDLWQVLARHIKPNSLSITWTDGKLDDQNSNANSRNSLRWFGIDPARPDGSGEIKRCASPPYNSEETLQNIEVPNVGAYCALWTHHNQKNWPRAIKIRFLMRDPRMPQEFRGDDNQGNLAYEVICDLGQ